jgi:hypothetical protein
VVEEMSEPGPPLDPEELRRLEHMAREAGNMPDFAAAAIEAITAVHAQWYRSWQAAGIPVHRAAEWTGIMIRASFSSPA